MDRDEALRLLKGGLDGVAEWNRRREAGEEIPDLSGAHLAGARLNRADLREAKLGGADLGGADLGRADLREADLGGADLGGAYLGGAYLREAKLSGANLRRADLGGADLRVADLIKADLGRADLREAKLGGADLRRADLGGADLGRANLRRANLRRANLREADLREAKLGGADLGGANLRRAKLGEADLVGANLGEADLIKANLGIADLGRANLGEAALGWANLIKANLGGANLNGAKCYGTIFVDVDLSRVEGLESIQHDGPSHVSTDTLIRSRGEIPEVFLRGCGVPEVLITHLPSLIGALKPIQFYSCFISYSTKDENFAQRLHSRMRDKGLRVWFAPEDMKAGRYHNEQIEHAIQVYDKLLLVLSEASMASEWVRREIRKARETEAREERRKLFPIRLVGIDVVQAWECVDPRTGQDYAEEVLRYHIPDFTNWKDHDAFEKGFDRLLRDLKAEESTAK